MASQLEKKVGSEYRREQIQEFLDVAMELVSHASWCVKEAPSKRDKNVQTNSSAMSPFSKQCQNFCWLSLAFIIDLRVVHVKWASYSFAPSILPLYCTDKDSYTFLLKGTLLVMNYYFSEGWRFTTHQIQSMMNTQWVIGYSQLW